LKEIDRRLTVCYWVRFSLSGLSAWKISSLHSDPFS